MLVGVRTAAHGVEVHGVAAHGVEADRVAARGIQAVALRQEVLSIVSRAKADGFDVAFLVKFLVVAFLLAEAREHQDFRV